MEQTTSTDTTKRLHAVLEAVEGTIFCVVAVVFGLLLFFLLTHWQWGTRVMASLRP